MALLFVPLTTVAMATISRERMGYATSLFNLMRNIGGSVGIAITGTMLQRQRQVLGTQFGENITAFDPTTQSMFAQIRNGMMAAGADVATATQRAYIILHGMLLQQASMVSFIMLFRLLGVVFIALIPLIFIMKRPKAGGEPVVAH